MVIRSSDVTATTVTSFKELYIEDSLCAALSAAGYDRPSPVQEAVLPLCLSGADLIVQATSGTGKTVLISCSCLNQARKAATPDQTVVRSRVPCLCSTASSACAPMPQHLACVKSANKIRKSGRLRQFLSKSGVHGTMPLPSSVQINVTSPRSDALCLRAARRQLLDSRLICLRHAAASHALPKHPANPFACGHNACGKA